MKGADRENIRRKWGLSYCAAAYGAYGLETSVNGLYRMLGEITGFVGEPN
ncbi:MAG: hypothetical protein ACRDIX_09145 [Actinomycetota bacterium]